VRKLIPFLIVLTTLSIQLSSGMNYVIFPLKLQEQGHSNTLIGLAMSFEILATILLFKHISIIVKRLGVIQTIIGASIMRSIVIYSLGFNDHYILWLLGIFIYGLSTSMLLVVIQTWLNLTSAGKLKGLFIGLYSSSLSLGIALGPIVLQFVSEEWLQFLVNAIFPLLTVLILINIFKYKPKIEASNTIRIKFIFRHSKIVMLSALVGGVCFFGLPSFLTIYGIDNGLTPSESSLLLTMFMIGSVCIGVVISSLSAFIERIVLLLVCIFLSVVCSVFLALAVFSDLKIALALLLIWGGCMGGVYATGLGFIGEIFRKEDQISANTSFILMDSLGGFMGLFIIGSTMDIFGSEGLTYTIVIIFTLFLFFITNHLASRVDLFK